MTATKGLPRFTVSLVPPSGPVVALQNIQQVIISKGRRKQTDLISAGTGTVTGRRPDLLPTLRIGDVIAVSLVVDLVPTGTASEGFTYRVADLRINYGEVSAMDTWELELEDAFAYLGRATLPTTSIASGTNTATAAATIATNAGLTQANIPSTAATTTTTNAITVTNDNALDVYQTLVNTEQAQVYALADQINWYARSSWVQDAALTVFSDTTTVGSLDYNGFQGATLADNYADKVIVRVRGGSEVVTGTGIFSYNLDSYSFDVQQATFLGQFILGSLDVDFETPRVLSVLVNGQDSDVLRPLRTSPQEVAVEFRGDDTINFVLGFTIFGNLDETRYDLYLTNSSSYNFFILDDAVFGKLDENKLGW